MLRIHTGFLGILASCTIALLTLTPSPSGAKSGYRFTPSEATAFPNLEFNDLSGNPTSLKDNLGKITIVHFWATWCTPCIAELPKLNEIQKKYEKQGLKVISISVDAEASKTKVETFLQTHNITALKPYIDSKMKAINAAQASGIPTSFFLNAKGEKIALIEGNFEWQSAKSTDFIEANLP